MIRFIPNGFAWLFKRVSWPKYPKPEASCWLSRPRLGHAAVTVWDCPACEFSVCHHLLSYLPVCFSVKWECLLNTLNPQSLIILPLLMPLKTFSDLEFPFNIGKFCFVALRRKFRQRLAFNAEFECSKASWFQLKFKPFELSWDTGSSTPQHRKTQSYHARSRVPGNEIRPKWIDGLWKIKIKNSTCNLTAHYEKRETLAFRFWG